MDPEKEGTELDQKYQKHEMIGWFDIQEDEFPPLLVVSQVEWWVQCETQCLVFALIRSYECCTTRPTLSGIDIVS